MGDIHAEPIAEETQVQQDALWGGVSAELRPDAKADSCLGLQDAFECPASIQSGRVEEQLTSEQVAQ